MAVYERETRVDAPLEEVWSFYSTTDGLVALTPAWFDLRVERVTGPDGEPNPSVLHAGTTVELSVRPLGAGPRQHTTSVIEERRRENGAATFRDRMVEGPFEEWVHTHAFTEADGGTVVRDRVEYGLPGGVAGNLAARTLVVGLAPLFRYRHRQTRELLER